MGWFSVTSTIRSANGANVVFAFLTQDADDIEGFADELAENGLIAGVRYRVRNHREGGGVLEEPRRFLLTREGVASVAEFDGIDRFEVVEGEG